MDTLQTARKLISKIMHLASNRKAMPIAWFGGIALLLVLVSGFSSQSHVPSLVHLADRLDRAAVIPEETRMQLGSLIEQINRDAKTHPHLHDRNWEAAARIERAIFIKPIDVIE